MVFNTVQLPNLTTFFLHSHNILLYEDGHAVVADFGGKSLGIKRTKDIYLVSREGGTVIIGETIINYRSKL